MTLGEAAEGGDRLATLRELRRVLAASIDASDSGRDIAALSRQLTDVLSQIEAAERLAEPKKGTPLDELARRRRGAAAGGGARPAGT